MTDPIIDNTDSKIMDNKDVCADYLRVIVDWLNIVISIFVIVQARLKFLKALTMFLCVRLDMNKKKIKII